MPLYAHLRELRRRVLFALIGVVIGGVAGWVIYPQVFEALQEPVAGITADGTAAALNFTNVATSFDMRVKISLFLGVIVSSPWWLYQLWAFVTPGLTRGERRTAVGFLSAAVPLFVAGTVLAWLVLPRAVAFLTDFTPEGAVNFIDAQMYLGFVMGVMLIFGVAFVLPVIMVALNLIGLVSARVWLAGWRWAVVAIFAFAAVATPTSDVITMLALAFPMSGLYFGAVGLCALNDRRRAKKFAATLAEPI